MLQSGFPSPFLVHTASITVKFIYRANPVLPEKTENLADLEMLVIKVTVEIQVHREQLANQESKEHREPPDLTDLRESVEPMVEQEPPVNEERSEIRETPELQAKLVLLDVAELRDTKEPWDDMVSVELLETQGRRETKDSQDKTVILVPRSVINGF